MYEIDKTQFGAFVAGLRKDLGMTQRELAEKLYVSNKAVSKWETGVSVPDISLLIPLSEALGVSVTELLQCQKLPGREAMAPELVEDLVKTAIGLSAETAPEGRFRKKGLPLYCLCLLIACLELGAAWQLGLSFRQDFLVVMILAAVFGVYFWCLIPERLPDYYDQNRIHAYSDGFFRMNIPGVRFTNRNWPHIVRCGQRWCLAVLVLYVPLSGLLGLLPQGMWMLYIPLAVTLAGLFGPMIYVGRKYQ